MILLRLLALVLTLAAVPAAARTYDILIERQRQEIMPGRRDLVVTMNGTVPGPTLRFVEGEQAEIRVTNKLAETASIHWHGLLLDGAQDGAPGFNGFAGIAPGTTHVYRIKLRQSGTYWYHAHSSGQEQSGQYAALIITPKDADPIVSDREHVVLLSELTREQPGRILKNLKADSGWYNWNKRTFPELMRDAAKFGMGKTLAERRAWGDMRMDATDIADVTGYDLLLAGQPTARRPWLAFKPGERVRLRFINGSAMSFMDVRIPGLAMTIVAADGRPVEPVTVDEFRMGVAETYDVIVEPREDRAYPLWVETLDRRAHVLGALSPRAGMAVTAPPLRPKQVLMLSEMGHAMAGMTMAAAPAPGAAPAAADPKCPPEHAAMGHCTPTAQAPAVVDPKCPPEHAAMGHCMPAAPVPAAADPKCPPEHAAMGHCTPAAPAPGGPRMGTAVTAAARGDTGLPYPRVDYGFGSDPMAGMDHAAMGHSMMAMPVLGAEGETDGSGRVFGWATGAPYGARVLSVRDLAALRPVADARPPTRELVIRIQGNMERYIWTLNGQKFGDAPPLRVRFNERVRITFVNETMMAHPMHLHGMFFQVDNGQPLEKMPEKNVIAVAPGRTQSIIVTANEAGEWPLHCHLLYHMESGMMRKFIVASVDAPDGTPAAPAAGHGSH
ncbi:multicopper oxidase domain-containing protein [Sandarakinorhabdus sp.]|uniref:multicopper oxidase domain-containing protein n=1 Tax=Sandarakinorhabdus sp. TaxID=1916663 RepID=UPI00286E828D|nr:multicopper oxidase domain-containing protein [Sandarakinorhabdus sp.]